MSRRSAASRAPAGFIHPIAKIVLETTVRAATAVVARVEEHRAEETALGVRREEWPETRPEDRVETRAETEAEIPGEAELKAAPTDQVVAARPRKVEAAVRAVAAVALALGQAAAP